MLRARLDGVSPSRGYEYESCPIGAPIGARTSCPHVADFEYEYEHEYEYERGRYTGDLILMR